MAWAAVFLKNFITLNEKHFINVNQRMSDGKRRKGISTITQKVLGCSDYDVAVPLSPSEIYVAFRRYTHQKQNGKEYRLDLSDIKDFSPINLGDFFNFILKKFEKSDMSFYDSLEDVVKKLNIKNVLDDGQTVSVSSFDSAMLIETDDELSDDNII